MGQRGEREITGVIREELSILLAVATQFLRMALTLVKIICFFASDREVPLSEKDNAMGRQRCLKNNK